MALRGGTQRRRTGWNRAAALGTDGVQGRRECEAGEWGGDAKDYGISVSVVVEFWNVTDSARTCFGYARRTQNGAAYGFPLNKCIVKGAGR